MDNVPQKRPEQLDDSNHGSPSLTLPNRSRVDTQNHPAETSNGRRELSASVAVNARSASAEEEDDDDDDDYTSSSGSSLSSSDDEDDDDDDVQSESAGAINGDNERITSLPARRKPNIHRIEQEPSLLSRLSAFLPQMKYANEDLERKIAAGRGKEIRLDDDVDEESDGQREGQYIEMNLGLGVLEEKRPGYEEKDSSESRGQSEETDLMDRLMGKEKTSSSAKPSIQDLGE